MQNKTSEISKNALSGTLGLLCAEQTVGNLKKIYVLELRDPCAQNKPQTPENPGLTLVTNWVSFKKIISFDFLIAAVLHGAWKAVHAIATTTCYLAYHSLTLACTRKALVLVLNRYAGFQKCIMALLSFVSKRSPHKSDRLLPPNKTSFS